MGSSGTNIPLSPSLGTPPPKAKGTSPPSAPEMPCCPNENTTPCCTCCLCSACNYTLLHFSSVSNDKMVVCEDKRHQETRSNRRGRRIGLKGGGGGNRGNMGNGDFTLSLILSPQLLRFLPNKLETLGENHMTLVLRFAPSSSVLSLSCSLPSSRHLGPSFFVFQNTRLYQPSTTGKKMAEVM